LQKLPRRPSVSLNALDLTAAGSEILVTMLALARSALAPQQHDFANQVIPRFVAANAQHLVSLLAIGADFSPIRMTLHAK
jgi:hypothetical protein